MEKCSYCDGEGKIKVKPYPEDHDYFKYEYRITICPHCHGCGIEPAKKLWKRRNSGISNRY